jgi:putative transposase
LVIDYQHTSRRVDLQKITCSYHHVTPPSDDDLKLMKIIDKIHLSRQFLGVRVITDSHYHKRVYRLMKKIGIQAIYPKPNTSKKHPENKIYPYSLRGVTINQPIQGVGRRYNVCADELGLCLFNGDNGLVQP